MASSNIYNFIITTKKTTTNVHEKCHECGKSCMYCNTHRIPAGRAITQKSLETLTHIIWFADQFIYKLVNLLLFASLFTPAWNFVCGYFYPCICPDVSWHVCGCWIITTVLILETWYNTQCVFYSKGASVRWNCFASTQWKDKIFFLGHCHWMWQ